MKTLTIVRHGKSDWSYNGVKDIDRCLKERGINDGYEMARRCKDRGLIPDLIISSTATRAMHTALIFSRVLELSTEEIKVTGDLYLSGVEEIMSVIYGINDDINSLMIFGHNPGFTDLADHLSNLNIMNVPTTGMVVLEFDTEKWTSVSRNSIINEEFDFPRNR